MWLGATLRGFSVSIILLAVALGAVAGCGDINDERSTCATCAVTPDAIPADDHRPTGVYKGVLTGTDETGTVMASVSTDQTEGSAVVAEGGDVYTASSFEIDDVDGNPQYTFSSNVFVFIFLVSSADGEVISASLTLNGVEIHIDLVKETSDELVKAFEGTWSGSGYDGYWNFAVKGSYLVGSFYGDEMGHYTGTIAGSEASIQMGGYPLATGHVGSDTASGSWHLEEWVGSWSGKRTL
jgi:hypothetical protein